MSLPACPRELVLLLRLHLATLGREGLAAEILCRLGHLRSIFESDAESLARLPRVGPRAARRILSAEIAAVARREVERASRGEMVIFARDVVAEIARPMPPQLASLDGMPPVLFGRGDWRPEDDLAIGIVGSRRATPYGIRQAVRFAEAFARRGVTVVSGLARGIDGAAQRSAIDAGGRTIAVLGAGLGRIYPPEHRGLAERIAASGRGVVLTEHPWDAPPRAYHFPQRNRVISALSRVVLVVEAGERSGSLITVDQALRFNRSVWAVPGRVDTPEARGALELLRDGAHPALDPEDVLEDPAIGLSRSAAGAERSRAKRVALPGPIGPSLEALFAEEDTWATDSIALRLDRPVPEILIELTRLELEGLLRRTADGWERIG